MKAFRVLNWSEQLATGLNNVDHEHRQLIDIINRLGILFSRDASVEEVQPLLARLREYTTYHFHNEEVMMGALPLNAPNKENHLRAHADFIKQIIKAEELFASHTNLVVEYLLAFLVKWLVHHITGVDARMAREILAIRAGNTGFKTGEPEDPMHDALIDTVSDLYDSLGARTLEMMEANRQLQLYHDKQQAENALAQDIIRRQIQRDELSTHQLSYWLLPAADFSGDIIASIRGPQGQIYALMADATGHGLAAAITVLPVLSVFNAMAIRGRTLKEMLGEINRHLRETVPVGRFVAATMLCINNAENTAEVWIGGMPDMLVFNRDGRLGEKLTSMQLPLGIVDFSADMAVTTKITWEAGSQFMIYSDGLVEAACQTGEPFGEYRVIEVMMASAPEKRMKALQDALAKHMGSALPHDDISVLLINCESGDKSGRKTVV